jgi:UDP-N-acetylmuramate--alanine ligase
MDISRFPVSFEGTDIYMVGIKGTGMAALAEYLVKAGANVEGSDTPEVFPTDAMLQKLKIIPKEGFEDEHISKRFDLLIHSSAYDPDTNPELKAAAALGIPVAAYPEALGAISKNQPSAGISGVHGKTTTTALSSIFVKAFGLPGSVLVPTAVPDIDGNSVYSGGDKFFVTETCEWRRNFLYYHPEWAVLTSLELDHPDYFKDYNDVKDAFCSFLYRLKQEGTVIYCADNPGVVSCINDVRKQRGDLKLIPYGKHASGPYRIILEKSVPGYNCFRLYGIDKLFQIGQPGEHLILDAAAAFILTIEIAQYLGIEYKDKFDNAAEALRSFRGIRRRSELIGEEKGVLFYDDYGHHPTAISKTIAGFKSFFPTRRIVVDFMPHTYSRTKALLNDFAAAFKDADALILHEIYASAREEKNKDPELDEILFNLIRNTRNEVYFFPKPMDALSFLAQYLREEDLFLTIGAGNNWKLGKKLKEKLS